MLLLRRRFLAAGLLAGVSAPVAWRSQETSVVVQVLAAADGTPLVNAEVIDRETSARSLTREQGTVRVSVLRDRPLQLRVRQLGFAFADRTVRHEGLVGGGADTITVRLRRVAFALPSVTTTAARDCPPIALEARPLALWALGQLREGAERYDAFRKAYPFRVFTERRTSRRRGSDTTFVWRSQMETGMSDRWGDRYRPGEVVRTEPLGYSLPILFIATLGDPRFWDHHCVTTAAVEGEDGDRRVRLHFVPSPSAQGSDWAGAAVMDSAGSLLRSIEFRLRVAQPDGPRRLEGITTFRSPSPLIAIPDSTAAVWWRGGPAANGEWGQPDVVQLVRLDRIVYRKAKPPQ